MRLLTKVQARELKFGRANIFAKKLDILHQAIYLNFFFTMQDDNCCGSNHIKLKKKEITREILLFQIISDSDSSMKNQDLQRDWNEGT